MHSFDSIRMLAPQKFAWLTKLVFFWWSERPLSIILIDDMLPSKVVFKGSNSDLANVTISLFLEILQSQMLS